VTVRGRWIGLGLGLAGLFAVGLVAGGRPWSRAEALRLSGDGARALYNRGLDAWARGDERGMLRAMRAAWDEEPGYLPPLLDMLRYYVSSYQIPDSVRGGLETMAARANPVTRYCLQVVLAETDSRPPPGAPVASERSLSTPCVWYASLGSPYRPDTSHLQLTAARWLWGRYPESLEIVSRYLAELEAAGWWDSVAFHAGRLTGSGSHPLLRTAGHVELIRALHALGRHEEALAAERAVAAFLAASPPRIRMAAITGGAHFGTSSVPADSALRGHADSVNLASAEQRRALRGAPHPEVSLYLRVGDALNALDNGELSRSLIQWDSILGLPGIRGRETLEVFALVRRGRAQAKVGDWAAAERDLLTAREAASRHRNLPNAYEAEHNLLHLYEAQDREPEALAAGESFVALTSQGGLSAVRMMSRRDLAWFHQRRGRSEAARRHFAGMVADLDSLNDAIHSYDFFAGEYYELTGDLDRATHYYNRAAAQIDPARALEALARVAEATGDPASAEEYVRRHDRIAASNNPESRPLLPGLLGRSGRWDEAEGELRQSRAAATDRGQLAGWARLSLELAELLTRQGRQTEAAELADSAADGADRVAQAEIALRARAVAALAQVRLGGPKRWHGLASLQRLSGRAKRFGSPQLEADVLLQWGEGLASTSLLTEALEVFRRAADLTDSIAVSLAYEPARAGFRGASQHRVSDRALEAIVARASERHAGEWYSEWARWRKGREIAGDVRRSRHQFWNTGGQTLSRIRGRLGPDRALVDYVILDTTVAALVVTDLNAMITVLPVSAQTLGERVGALVRGLAPRLGSFVDRGRANFDADLARSLYVDLLEPLEPLIGARRSLTIVPDGPLHLLPFDALVAEDATSGPVFALDRYAITLATSLGIHNGWADAPLAPGPILAIGGPASGVAAGMDRELEMLGTVAPGREVLRHEVGRGTEAVVREHAARAAVLHFAAHARPNPHQPDYSEITLTPAGEDDGILHGYEIRELRLSGGLVVLSGCESASGRLAGGEGVLSLSRSFLQAGASGVVGTLWPIGPATVELMAGFYRELNAGRAPSEALHHAKLTVREGSHSDPFLWAPFTLVTRGP